MAIIKVGLREAEKSQGSNPTGIKRFLVGSDTKISDNIDPILDASVLGGNGVPSYNDLWSIDTTVNLRVDNKRSFAYDSDDGVQEGFWWIVEVNYAVPDISNNQSAEDPTARDWLWSKSSEKEETTLSFSLYDTTDYVYPSGAVDMVNLGQGDAATNTAGEPPENGVTRQESNRVITMSKYINEVTDLGVADWDELDEFIDTVNDGIVSLLDVDYDKWQLRMDDIDYEPVSENGYDVIRVVFRVTANKKKTHVFSYPSAGYNQLIDGDLVKIKNTKTGEDIQSPRLLDSTGAVIPEPESAPYLAEPTLVLCGKNELADWSSLNLPETIP